MNSKKVTIPLITQQHFFELWEETWTKPSDDKNKIYNFFKSTIESIPSLTLGEYYWQIFYNSQPYPKILMAEGAVSELTPFDSKGLVNSTVEEFFALFHPDDLPHVLAFMSNIFRIIIDEHSSKRKNYNITMYARIKNGDGLYVWNSIQYPALYFDDNDNFLYGMVLYTNVHHIMVRHTEAMMTVLNSNDLKHQQLIHYTISNMNGVPKIYPTVSKREKEIIVLLGKGKSSKQIADILNISKNTVDNHRQRLLKKFNANSSSELIIKVMLL